MQDDILPPPSTSYPTEPIPDEGTRLGLMTLLAHHVRRAEELSARLAAHGGTA